MSVCLSACLSLTGATWVGDATAFEPQPTVFFFAARAPRALNMALTTRPTPYEKIALRELYPVAELELPTYDTFQTMAFFRDYQTFWQLSFIFLLPGP